MQLITNDNFGVIEKNNVPVVSSRNVAEVFDKKHDDVLKSIRNLIEGLGEITESKWVLNFKESSYKNNQNKKQPEYLMTRDGFTLLAMGFTGKKALQFKTQYIERFNQMETFIKDLLETKAEFPEFTDAILSAHEEPKHYHFSNECNMINTIVLGMTASKFRELHNIDKSKSIRPYLTPGQLKAIKTLQRFDIGLVISVPDFQQRKQLLEKQYQRLQINQLSA